MHGATDDRSEVSPSPVSVEGADDAGSLQVESLEGAPALNEPLHSSQLDSTLQAIESLRAQQVQMFKELTTLIESAMTAHAPGHGAMMPTPSDAVLALPSSGAGAVLRPTSCDRFLSAGTTCTADGRAAPYTVLESPNVGRRPRKKSVVRILPYSEVMEKELSEPSFPGQTTRPSTEAGSTALDGSMRPSHISPSSVISGDGEDDHPFVSTSPTSIAANVRRKTIRYLRWNKSMRESAHNGRSSRVMAFEEAEKAKKDRANLVGQSRQNALAVPRSEEMTRTMEVKHWIRGHTFDLVCAVVVLAHAVVIAAQIEYLYEHKSGSNSLQKLDVVFVVIYVLELLLRLWASGCVRFIAGRDRLWNIGDAIVVGISVFYLLVEQAGPTGLTFVRVLRTLRVVRVVRIVRITRFFKQLRMLVYAIASTLKTCMWTILMMVVVVYLFTLIISQSVANYFADENSADSSVSEGEREALLSYFGSLQDTAFTLYMAIAGGIDWEVAVDPLFKVGWWVGAVFLLYITFMIICVMNLMTGFFVESAIDAASSDREHLVQSQLQESARYKKELQDLFEQWDVSGDQQLTLEEFQRRLEEPRVCALYQSLEIDPSDAWSFFKLLDKDGSGFVDLEEFLDGCIRLKGKATGFHMERIMYENKWIMEMVAKVSQDISQVMDNMFRLPSQGGDRVQKELSSSNPYSVRELRQPQISASGHVQSITPTGQSGMMCLPKGEPKELTPVTDMSEK
mmetsp:Transcript_59944/g.134717  ORF Transcript_59944/g.134717 Transcript_59944/m.134717 type:complete len:737 (+) Transcript_59944:75-2285(+)